MLKVTFAILIGLIIGSAGMATYVHLTLPVQCLEIGAEKLGQAKDIFDTFKK